MGFVCRNRNPCDLTTSYCRDTCLPPGYRCVICPKYHEIRYEQYCQLKGELHFDNTDISAFQNKNFYVWKENQIVKALQPMNHKTCILTYSAKGLRYLSYIH